MSPTSPSFVTLNDQLNKAHHRIRQLEAREVELLARIASLRANIAASRATRERASVRAGGIDARVPGRHVEGR